jgi:two-component system sensor kinase FixL
MPPDQTARLLASIVASSDDAIISKTIDGVVTSWNRGAERMFGYAAEEVVGGPIAILATPGREDEMPGILERLRRGERVEHFETNRRRKDGGVLAVSLTVSPILDDAGRVIGASKVARDITAARAAAESLREARALLLEQHRQLTHAARLGELGQMAAILAHEINQPLSAVVNYVRGCQRLLAMDDPVARSRIEEAMRAAGDQAMRASEIVRHLRSFARPQEGVQRPESISRIIDESATLATIDAGRRGVTVARIARLDNDLVFADRIGVQQVLLNLIRNALEAMDGHDRPRLELSAVSREDVVEVAVSDTGPGLAAMVRERLFEPFVTTKGAGMGIGLSICRQIIERHGGRMWVDDNPGGGATFRFTLRAAPPA